MSTLCATFLEMSIIISHNQYYLKLRYVYDNLSYQLMNINRYQQIILPFLIPQILFPFIHITDKIPNHFFLLLQSCSPNKFHSNWILITKIDENNQINALLVLNYLLPMFTFGKQKPCTIKNWKNDISNSTSVSRSGFTPN